MQFLTRPPGQVSRLGILPGSFNPPTRAHLILAEAALSKVDAIVLVLPRTFPHKDYTGADFTQRISMLCAAVDGRSRLSAAVSEGGLFAEIAEEYWAAHGSGTELAFVCGRDAAERIMTWDYGDPVRLTRMLETFRLLVASRDGEYDPPDVWRHRIDPLAVPEDLGAISASEVRRRIQARLAWESLVPEAIVPLVRRIYLPAE